MDRHVVVVAGGSLGLEVARRLEQAGVAGEVVATVEDAERALRDQRLEAMAELCAVERALDIRAYRLDPEAELRREPMFVPRFDVRRERTHPTSARELRVAERRRRR